jgi:hypothetical protein
MMGLYIERARVHAVWPLLAGISPFGSIALVLLYFLEEKRTRPAKKAPRDLNPGEQSGERV